MTKPEDLKVGDLVRIGTGRIVWRVDLNTATDPDLGGLGLAPSVTLVETYGEARTVGPYSRRRLVFGLDRVARLVRL